jgi:Flp pilus assembly protein TadB
MSHLRPKPVKIVTRGKTSASSWIIASALMTWLAVASGALANPLVALGWAIFVLVIVTRAVRHIRREARKRRERAALKQKPVPVTGTYNPLKAWQEAAGSGVDMNEWDVK